jgi:hypothetical protein
MPTYATSVMASGSHGKSFEVQHRARHSNFFCGNVGLTCFIAAEYFERPMKSDFYGQAAQNLNSGISSPVLEQLKLSSGSGVGCNKGGVLGFSH